MVQNTHEILPVQGDFYDAKEHLAKRAKSAPTHSSVASLEEVQAFYGEIFDAPSVEDLSKKEKISEQLKEAYEKIGSQWMLFIQGSDTDKFLQEVSGTLGPYSSKLTIKCPLFYTHDDEYYRFHGMGMMDAQVAAQVRKVLYSPGLKKVYDNITNEDNFFKDILQNRKLRWLWSQTVSYGLLLGMDSKVARYVDKSRQKANKDSYKLFLTRVLEHTRKHFEK